VTFTDQFDATAGGLSPHQLHNSSSAQGARYTSSRLDGARAVANTMELVGSRIAVVASTTQVQYGYDNASNRTTVTDPSGTRTAAFDARNRLLSVSGTAQLVETYTWSARGP
jgi:YD repeat-containing protein